MEIDQLLQRVASQPELRETRSVQVWGPTLRAAFESGELRMINEIHAHPDQTTEEKTFRYGHLCGAPVSPSQLADWQARFPEHPLPTDVADLLLRLNGLHLWADLEFGRAYFGLAPLDEWHDSTSNDGPLLFEEAQPGMLVISYHQNGDYYLVLDTAKSTYHWFDHEDIDHPQTVASSVSELLDWLWNEARQLRPDGT